MACHGQTLATAGVGLIGLEHGTFVGNDPFDFARLTRSRLPAFGGRLIRVINQAYRFQSNLLLGDRANFHPGYSGLLEASLGHDVKVKNFQWASGNHHIARLFGAVELVSRLARAAQGLPDESRASAKKILLIGHSHAGQVFALFAHLIENSPLALDLLDFSLRLKLVDERLQEELATCRKFEIYYATLGAPIRYPWPEKSSKRLVNIVNHRGHEFLAGDKSRGSIFTKDGDYVQQLGAMGSDWPALSGGERRINRELDALLGVGRNPKLWGNALAQRTRVSPFGFTYLIDYHDHSSAVPNFISTILGHGVYTMYEAMEFNVRIIARHLFSEAVIR
jgi:hypothetical protein